MNAAKLSIITGGSSVSMLEMSRENRFRMRPDGFVL